MSKTYEVVKKGWHGSHHHFFSDVSVKMKSLKCFQCLKNHCIIIYCIPCLVVLFLSP